MGSTVEWFELQEVFPLLLRPDCEVHWDGIDIDIARRGNYSDEDVGFVLETIRTAPDLDGASYSCFHIMAAVDKSGDLLQNGMADTLVRGSGDLVQTASYFVNDLPAQPSEAFARAVRTCASRMGPDARLYEREIRLLLARCEGAQDVRAREFQVAEDAWFRASIRPGDDLARAEVLLSDRGYTASPCWGRKTRIACKDVDATKSFRLGPIAYRLRIALETEGDCVGSHVATAAKVQPTRPWWWL